jgi:hypothetical protein
VALAREEVPAEAFALLSAWIEGERLLVDGREDVGGITFCRMDAKAMAPLPHIVASFFARLPYKRKAGHSPRWNGFSMLLYRDVEEGWKLLRIRRALPTPSLSRCSRRGSRRLRRSPSGSTTIWETAKE